MSNLTRAEQMLLDLRPIEIPGFTLRARSVVVKGKPKSEQWLAAIRFASSVHEAAPYWIGDLLTHAESREDWREVMDQLIAETGLTRKTLENYGYLASHVEEPERAIAPSPAHAAEVAPLERVDQTKYLEQARTEGWTRNELRRRIRSDQRTRIIDGQAVLEGMYRVIYADPAWLYSDSRAIADSSAYGGAENHYAGMTIEAIAALPVAAHALPDSVLFMWVTSPMLDVCWPVIDAWGFEYKTSIVWDKVLGNYGHYVRVHHELLLVCTRGSCLPDEPTPMPDSVQVIRRGDEHSAKPDDFRKLIMKLYTRGPYLELFGRKRVEGWTVFGNDARLWAEEAATNA